MTDSLTGLYAFSAGMELVGQCRMTGHKGVMIVFCLDQLKETNEKNGIVFGDMVLEEVGNLIRISCQKLTESTGQQTAAFRLNGAEFVMWIGGLVEGAGGRLYGRFSVTRLRKISIQTCLACIWQRGWPGEMKAIQWSG